MHNIKNDLDFFNSYLSEVGDVDLIEKMTYAKETKSFEGKISLKRNTFFVEFKIQIPIDYPYQDAKFYCLNFEGYPHQNYDKTVCLNTPFVNHLHTRLQLDLDKLRKWVSSYIEDQKKDKHYEYSPADFKGYVQFLFQENAFLQERFSKSNFGEMQYSVSNAEYLKNGKISTLTAFVQKIGNINIEWSSVYKSKNNYTGIWVYLEEEPVEKQKKRFERWEDFAKVLPKDFIQYFDDFCSKTASYKIGPKSFQEKIFLCVGYKIPQNNTSNEVHWDLILIPKNNFPRKRRKKLNEYKAKISWERTYNCAYQRFFGRGAFVPQIANSKVLIIGVGAIGSAISEILVRGGAKYVDFSDIDYVEPGNICRSLYSFSDVGAPKAYQLKNKLTNISPFVEINTPTNIKPISEKSEFFEEVKKQLNNYSIIFDCSANNGVVQMLENLKLSSTILYVSMTNKAKEIICICSTDSKSLTERRNQTLYSLNGIQQAEFREGTGCWHPTFEASYFDINQLLHYTLKKINESYKANLPLKSFYAYSKDGAIGNSEDIKFVQKDLGLTITIESLCIDKIIKHMWAHYPKEFGGIFVGNYINNYKEIIISNIITPKKFKNSAYSFQPDPDDLNKQLRMTYKKSNGKIIYVGDWHTHPNSNNHYSTSDFESIQGVAQSSRVNTCTPILMIAAFSQNYFEPGFYVYFKGKLYKYEMLL